MALEHGAARLAARKVHQDALLEPPQHRLIQLPAEMQCSIGSSPWTVPSPIAAPQDLSRRGGLENSELSRDGPSVNGTELLFFLEAENSTSGMPLGLKRLGLSEFV